MADARKVSTKEAVEALPFETQLGYDVQRMWTTGVQIFGNTGHVLIVFREQTSKSEPDGEATLHVRNVGSAIMPLAVAKEMHAILGKVLDGLPEDGEDS